MIHVRTNAQACTVALLSLLAGAAFLVAQPLVFLRHLRNPLSAARRVIKPAALWWNAWQYKQAEEDIAYFASFKLRLDADACRQRVRQRKLQKRRERVNEW